MRWHSHLALGIFISLILTPYFHFSFLFWATLPLFILLPDIDIGTSYLGRKLKWASRFLNAVFGHRGLFHSLLFVAGGSILCLLISKSIALAFLFGTLSHLLGDVITKEGLALFYPLPFRTRGFLRTGSWMEHVIFIALLVGIFYVV